MSESTTDTAATSEAAIRRYLDFVADPTSVVDHARIASLEAELVGSKDLIQQLHIHGSLEKARRADGEAVRAGFVKHARSYAATHDIPVSAFRSVGVSDIALAEAGFDLGFGNRGKSAVKSSAARQRAPKVSQSTIRSHILAVKGSFTLNDIMGDVGGSIGTVNTVVKDLIGEGLLKSKGPDADHQGRGRAPIRYATV